MKNHYTTLGLANHSSSDRQIKAAYKQLMLIHHPDKTRDPKLIEKGMQIMEAYNILSDPVERSQYDRRLQEDMKKVKNLTNRHFEAVQRDGDGEKMAVQCSQCMGETQIILSHGQEETHCDIFFNCYHCGLLMKVQ